MTRDKSQSLPEESADSQDAAARFVLRRRNGPWTETEQVGLDASLADPAGAAEIRRFERAWQAVGDHASSPELMVLREQALARARRANVRRWRLPQRIAKPWLVAAAVAVVAILSIGAWQLSPYAFIPGVYQTSVGEQRVVELSDRSTLR